jgi:hypothetical protein
MECADREKNQINQESTGIWAVVKKFGQVYEQKRITNGQELISNTF